MIEKPERRVKHSADNFLLCVAQCLFLSVIYDNMIIKILAKQQKDRNISFGLSFN